MNSSIENAVRTWHAQEIDFGSIRKEMVRDDENLFYLLASASFVEITSELYTSNLIEHFRKDKAVCGWLEQIWQHEELQHGETLKKYIQVVWPDFDWETAYSGFAAEYGAICTLEALEPSSALEMVARCVVETGTSTFYRCLYDYTQEPVLRHLLANIKADEVRHFKIFRHFFQEYNVIEGNRALRVWRVIWKRLVEVRNEDIYIAFKHAYQTRNHVAQCHDSEWRQFSRWLKTMARRFYPYEMTVKMLVSPLPVSNMLKKLIQSAMIGGFWLAMLY